MATTVFIFCMTFLLVMVAYWIMPTQKMKDVNEALTSLLKILPISKIFESFGKKNKED